MSSNFSRTEGKFDKTKELKMIFIFVPFGLMRSCVSEGERSTVAAAGQPSPEECVL